MPLVSSPPSDTISSDLADWLELAAFASTNGEATFDSVNEALEIEEDSEPEEIHDEDDLREARIQATFSAIEERLEALNGSYPFRLTPQGHAITLAASPRAGHSAYLLCLLLSHVSGDGSLDGRLLPGLDRSRDWFQVCATLCAASICGGPSFSFGWPRPDKTGFHEKLVQVFGHRAGNGIPRAEMPPGAPPKIKDGGIDVIAWKMESDGRPGIPYLLGQAASGKNWREKSVQSFIQRFHAFWFEHSPSSIPSPAMFIPFCLPEPQDQRADHWSQKEVLEGHLRYLEHDLGDIYCRYRIPGHADKAQALAADGIGPIERLEDVPRIEAWIREVRDLLRETR